MIVETIGPDGNPMCPIDQTPVEIEGQFCTMSCWLHFTIVATDLDEVLEMMYLPLEQQDWYEDGIKKNSA